MIASKKGLGLEWYFLIVAFFLGIIVYIVSIYGPHKIMDNYIGEYQFSILKASNEAEAAAFYIQEAADQSLHQSIYDLAQDGGISELDVNGNLVKHKCGKSNGAYVWHDIKKDTSGLVDSCFDENNLNENMKYHFNKNLNAYMAIYPADIPAGNYDYTVKGSLEVIGMAKRPLVFEIIKEEVSLWT